MKIDQEMLKRIGLTGSESRVYLALLEIGDFTSKRDILRLSKIAPSKVYHVLDRLMEKGLVSTIIKNNIRHFAPAPPARIKDYIAEKKEQITAEEKTAEDLLPKLEAMYKSVSEKTTAEIFVGWKGMETHYSRLITELERGDFVWTLGASKGEDPKRTNEFFTRMGSRYRNRGFKLKLLLDNNSRDYIEEQERNLKRKLPKRFLQTVSPVEICIVKHVVTIVMLKKEPIVIAIRDTDTAKSFKNYFEELWKIAKE
ncbi:hypothetical protein KY363_01830 [Candidatus Woesearchaeota archaeon]|nr:hypothetical protein [Candidatus Woesearchaeota archaeon]